ncbi:MAG TPA: hypothetical protein VKU02_13150 [Gemmataceae bacterium]|nr:hypothetical protein [Gemmataceae bacterium]
MATILMSVGDAQREVRAVFLRGSVGQLVSGAIWLLSAGLATWVGIREGIIALIVGGMFIYPLTQLVLWLLGGPCTLSPGNPLRQLAMQIAFIVPLTLPVVGGAALHNVNWFYPGCMIIVGAHYLPFMFLYGMWHFGVLAAALLGGGFLLGTRMPDEFVFGGWLAGAALVLFGIVAGRITRRERALPAPKQNASLGHGSKEAI